MERVYTIGADTHCAFTELATISPGGRLVRRNRCPTTISALVEAIAEVRRPRVVVIEEGPLADWRSRGLRERGASVPHAESFDRVAFKRRVAWYHDPVGHRVREANGLMTQCRQLGVFLRERDFAELERWPKCRNRLPNHKVVPADPHPLRRGYRQAIAQADRLRRGLLMLARKHRTIRRFRQVPGVAWIRAATF